MMKRILSAAYVGIAMVLLGMASMFIPLTISVALFRYRLWDIDIIINRTLVYGGLSLGIVAVYVLVLSMLEHISPIGWENVILYGEYVLNHNLVRS